MKKRISIISLSITIFLLAPLFFLDITANAAEIRYTEEDAIVDQLIEDDLYISGDRVEINEDIMGDLIASGGTITINDDIYGDAYIFGGLTTVNGNIQGNLVIFGGRIDVKGDVSQDLILAGGQLFVDGNVGDDARIAGGQVDIGDITVGDDLLVRAGSGSVSDKVAVENDKDIEYGEQAGTSGLGFIPTTTTITTNIFLNLLRNVAVLIGWLILGWALFKFIPIKSKQVTDIIAHKATMLKSFIFGCGGLLGFLILIPLLILLFIVGIGQPIVPLLMSLLGIALTVGGLYSSTALAKLVLESATKKKYTNYLVPMLIGVSVYQILGWIPCCLGITIKVIMTTWGVGGILFAKYQTMKHAPNRERKQSDSKKAEK